MDAKLKVEERARFNAISQEEARCIAAECDNAAPQMRSCWSCNGAHERLKEADYFTCFGCGISYVRGIPTVVLSMRMRGEEITDETMNQYEEALSESL